MKAAKPPVPAADAAAGEAPKKGGMMKLIFMAVPVILLLAGAGLWFTGILPHMLGMGPKPAKQVADATPKAPPAPVFADLPEMIANLDSTPRRPSYIKLKARVELSDPKDQAPFTAAMPRIQDMFQTYLREMRPEELRGSAGTYRLREELIARANIAAAPAHVTDVLFVEMLIQ